MSPNKYGMQDKLNTIATWTEENLMKLNEEKSNYIIFSKAREDFAARLTLNGKLLERKKVTKIAGVLLEEKGDLQDLPIFAKVPMQNWACLPNLNMLE